MSIRQCPLPIHYLHCAQLLRPISLLLVQANLKEWSTAFNWRMSPLRESFKVSKPAQRWRSRSSKRYNQHSTMLEHFAHQIVCFLSEIWKSILYDDKHQTQVGPRDFEVKCAGRNARVALLSATAFVHTAVQNSWSYAMGEAIQQAQGEDSRT